MSWDPKDEEEPGVLKGAKGRIFHGEGLACAKALRQERGQPGWSWPLVSLEQAAYRVHFAFSEALGSLSEENGESRVGRSTDSS